MNISHLMIILFMISLDFIIKICNNGMCYIVSELCLMMYYNRSNIENVMNVLIIEKYNFLLK